MSDEHATLRQRTIAAAAPGIQRRAAAAWTSVAQTHLPEYADGRAPTPEVDG
jgi:hypothetical protein